MNGFQDILVIIIAKVQFKYIFTFVVAIYSSSFHKTDICNQIFFGRVILKTGVKARFLMSPVLNSVVLLIESGFCGDKSGFFER